MTRFTAPATGQGPGIVGTAIIVTLRTSAYTAHASNFYIKGRSSLFGMGARERVLGVGTYEVA